MGNCDSGFALRAAVLQSKEPCSSSLLCMGYFAQLNVLRFIDIVSDINSTFFLSFSL